MTIANIEPDEITAGDTVQWTRSLPDYPAGTWTLSYTLINATHKIEITSTQSGTDHLVSVSAATSAGYNAGLYKWQAYATSGSQRVTIDNGEIQINPNYSEATTLDTRSHVKKTLDAIEAVLENRATLDQQSYTIGNRSLTRMPITDLIKWRDKYRSMYLAEQKADDIARGLGGKNKLFVRI